MGTSASWRGVTIFRPFQLFTWRRELRHAAEAAQASTQSSPKPMFVPAVIAPEPAVAPVPAPQRKRVRRTRDAAPAVVELKVDGVATKIARGGNRCAEGMIGPGTDAWVLVAILAFARRVTFCIDHPPPGAASRFDTAPVSLSAAKHSGGVEAWGLIWLFVGPAIMAALVPLWQKTAGKRPGSLAPPR